MNEPIQFCDKARLAAYPTEGVVAYELDWCGALMDRMYPATPAAIIEVDSTNLGKMNLLPKRPGFHRSALCSSLACDLA